jgi:hypothetical protein
MSMRSTALSTLAVLLGVLLLAHAALTAPSIVVTFKDGTRVKAELPQDVSQIKSVVFESDGGAATVQTTDLKNTVFSDGMDSGLGDKWDALACVGGDFGKFARFGGGKLAVNVPAGNHWGKTGIMSKKPLFSVDNTMDANPMKIVLDFDTSATIGYIVALAPVQHNDVWVTQNYWLHWGVAEDTKKGFLYSVNTQNSGDKATPPEDRDLPLDAPKRVVLSVSPGIVKASLPGGKTFTCSLGWLKSGTPVYLHVFSHPHNAGGPGGFALDAVTVGR